MTLLSMEQVSQNPILLKGEFGFCSELGMLKIGDGENKWNDLNLISIRPKPSFATADWNSIAEIASMGKASDYFKVGDEKTIYLSTGEEVGVIILGFNHDDLTSGGKASITIGMTNLLTTKYQMQTDDFGGWDNSIMRTKTLASIFSQLPNDLQNCIKQVNKLTSLGNMSSTIKASTDKLFLFSEVEINGTASNVYKGEGLQYEYWRSVKDGNAAVNRIKNLSNGKGATSSWWLRSAYTGDMGVFRNCSNNGSIINSSASSSLGVSFGFCI